MYSLRHGEWKPARAGPGGDHEGVPLEALAGGLVEEVDRLDATSEDELDAAIGPVSRRPQLDLLTRSAEKLLREAWALVRRVALLADERDTALEAEGSGACRRSGTQRDPRRRRRRGLVSRGLLLSARSKTEIAPIGQPKAASTTAPSSEIPSRTSAMPSPATSKTDGASSAHSPKPLQSDRSMTILYLLMVLPLRSWVWVGASPEVADVSARQAVAAETAPTAPRYRDSAQPAPESEPAMRPCAVAETKAVGGPVQVPPGPRPILLRSEKDA